MTGVPDLRTPSPRVVDATVSIVAVLLTIGALVAVGQSLLITVQGHFTLPFWDEWDTARDLRIAMTSGVAHVQWLARHSEHTIALTRAIAMVDGYAAAATNLVAVGAVWILTALLALEISIVASPRSTRGLGVRVIVFSAVVLFLFQPRNLENLTWGFQTGFTAVYLLALLAFDATCRVAEPAQRAGGLRLRRWLAVAGWLAAGLAAISLGNGFLAGFLCAVIALCGTAPRWYRVGTVVVAVVCLLPFVGLGAGLGQDPAAAQVSIITQTGPYLVALLSSPFVILGWPAIQFAVVGLFVVVLLMGFWGILRDPSALRGRWLQVASAVFLLASVLAIALARSKYAIESAYAGRYLVPVVGWWAVSLSLTIDVLFKRSWPRRISIAAAVIAVAVGCSSIVVGAPGEVRYYEQKGRDNRLAEAMIISGIRDDRLIKRIAYWPKDGEELLQFFQEYGLGPFASARARWRGLTATALFRGAAVEDISNECTIAAATPIFGDGAALALNTWSWKPTQERSGWFRISGHCGLLNRGRLSGDLVILQENDERIVGFGDIWSGMVDRGRADQATGAMQIVEFDAYVASESAQRFRVAVVDRHQSRIQRLGSVAVDPANVGWRSATDRDTLQGVIDTTIVNGRPQAPSACLPITQPTPVRLSGWALDLTTREPASAVILIGESGTPVFAGYGYPRPDVAREFGDANATFVGWNVELMLEPGQNQEAGWRVVVLSGDGRGKKVLSQRLLECGGESGR